MRSQVMIDCFRNTINRAVSCYSAARNEIYREKESAWVHP